MKTDPKISKRACSEICRLWTSSAEAAREIGCNENTIYAWQRGAAPSAVHLAMLHEHGADVIWILTGKRCNQ